MHKLTLSTATMSPKRLVTETSSIAPFLLSNAIQLTVALLPTLTARRTRRRSIKAIDVSARPMTMNDMTVVTVPTANSAGEVTSVVIAQIASGSVLLLPDVRTV